MHSLQELQTLPIGPSEIGKLWYARSRLGINQSIWFIWGAGCPPQGRWIVLTTRVFEKPFTLSAALLWEVLKLVDLSSTSQLVWWSDTGPHYRCYSHLGTALAVMEKYRVHFLVNYGCEHHMKHLADAKSSQLNHAKETGALTIMINSIEALHKVYRDDYESRKSINPEIADELYMHWVPPEKKSVVVRTLKKTGAVPNITTCHCWDFRFIAPDRVSFFGRGDRSRVATNVRAYPRKLSNQPRTDWFFPEIENFAVEEALGPAPDDDCGVEALGIKCQEFRGWKTSYRNEQPELTNFSSLRPKLARKLKDLGDVIDLTATRKKSIDTIRASFEKTSVKRKARDAVRYLKR